MKSRLCLIVSGSRHLRAREHAPAIAEWIEKQRDAHRAEHERSEHMLCIHGGQIGADLIANDAAVALGFDTWEIPYFRELDRPDDCLYLGGPLRNRCLIDIAVVLRKTTVYEIKMGAFPDSSSKGTWNAVRYAKEQKIIAEVFKQ